MVIFEKVDKFLMACVVLMGLYYSSVTGIVSCVGVSYCRKMHIWGLGPLGLERNAFSQAPILVLSFLPRGIHQIFNDFFRLEEDRINAPGRPSLTTGKIDKAAVVDLLINRLNTKPSGA